MNNGFNNQGNANYNGQGYQNNGYQNNNYGNIGAGAQGSDFIQDDQDVMQPGFGQQGYAGYGNQQQQQGMGQKLNQKMNQMGDAMNQMGDKMNQFSKQVQNDYRSDIGSGMSEKSKFGFKLYIYALILFGLFAVRSATCLVLLIAWLILVEDNKQLTRMAINTLAFYVIFDVVVSVAYDAFNLLYMSVQMFSINILMKLFSNIRSLISALTDPAFAIFGILGMLRAKSGNFFKLGFIDKMFTS